MEVESNLDFILAPFNTQQIISDYMSIKCTSAKVKIFKNEVDMTRYTLWNIVLICNTLEKV